MKTLIRPLKIGTETIQVKNENKYLGLIFDTTPSWHSHVKYLKARCQSRINLLQILQRHIWGPKQPPYCASIDHLSEAS